MIVYHRTSGAAASAIRREGFRDATGTYLTENLHTGVWVSDYPLDSNTGAHGDTLLRIALNVPDTALATFEWDEGSEKGYREFLIPAAVLNTHGTVELVDEDKDADIERLFWQRFGSQPSAVADALLPPQDWRTLDTFSFGDNLALAHELASLVLAGKKTATCWSIEDGATTEVGKRWVMLDGVGRPRAVIETVELKQQRFDEVDAAHAFDEGEGDRTLVYWRAAHQRYFTRLGQYAPDMMLYCERFRLLAIIDESPAP